MKKTLYISALCVLMSSCAFAHANSPYSDLPYSHTSMLAFEHFNKSYTLPHNETLCMSEYVNGGIAYPFKVEQYSDKIGLCKKIGPHCYEELDVLVYMNHFLIYSGHVQPISSTQADGLTVINKYIPGGPLYSTTIRECFYLNDPAHEIKKDVTLQMSAQYLD